MRTVCMTSGLPVRTIMRHSRTMVSSASTVDPFGVECEPIGSCPPCEGQDTLHD